MAQSVTYSVNGAPGGGLPIYSSSTPPTAAQAAFIQEVVVVVGLLLADTQALITHNWGFSASQAGNFYNPQVIGPCWINGPLGGGTNAPFLSFDWTNTNVLKVNKLGVAGTEGTFVLYLRRPHSIGR